jgi:hypothetical protein
MHGHNWLTLVTGGALTVAATASTEAMRTRQDPPAAPVYIDAVSSAEERAQLESLINEASSILRSAAFASNLMALQKHYPRIFANPDMPDVSPERLLNILRVKEPGTRYIRVPVALIGSAAYNDGSGSFNYIARTGSVHWNGEEPTGSMTLGRVNMYRYGLTDPVEKSCAINTMAHEISHTISRRAGKYIYAIADTSSGARPDKTVPLASYLVGAVAQCTWLQQKGRVGAGGVAACVKVFGTQNFNSNRCSQFGDGQPVVERDGLAEPAPPL